MKSQERIILTKKQWFNHFGISIVMLLLSLVFGIYSFMNPENTGSIYLIVIPLGVSIFFYWLNWDRLFFQEFKAGITEEQFKKAVTGTGLELNWEILELNENYAEIFRNPAWGEKGGEKIIIKKTKDKILINSMGNPNFASKGYSRKRNKDNINYFLANVNQALRGENIEENILSRQQRKEKEFWAESEWTIGKILMRIAGYGLTILFLLIGILMINGGDWLGMFAFIIPVVMSLTYIKNDIEVLREKHRRKKLKKKNKKPIF